MRKMTFEVYLSTLLNSVRVGGVAQAFALAQESATCNQTDLHCCCQSCRDSFENSCYTGHRCAHTAVARPRVGGIVHRSLFIVEHDNHFQAKEAMNSLDVTVLVFVYFPFLF